MRSARQMTRIVATGLVATGIMAAPMAAMAQQAPPAQNGNSGVLTPPSNVDPGIQAKPPLASSKLPTTVIPPPGTPGGDPSTQAK